MKWRPECNEVPADAVAEFGSLQRFGMSCATAPEELITQVAAFPGAADVHWETQIRETWNDQECAVERQELIYEVSWIPELGVWRRFLRSLRKA